MKAHHKPEWTAGVNTRVAKRKQAAFVKNITRAVVAMLTGPIDLSDYLNWSQIRILSRRAEAVGMDCGEFINDVIGRGLERANSLD